MFTSFFLEFSVELPPPNEDFDDLKGIKTITEYKINDDGKRVKVRFQSGLPMVYRARILKVRRIQNRFRRIQNRFADTHCTGCSLLSLD